MAALASISSAHASYTPHDSETARKLREKRPAHVVHRPGMKMVLGWSE
jgi:hypothetical protein